MFRFVLYALILFLLFRGTVAPVERRHGRPERGEPQRGAQVPQRGVQMVRDPVCGMFVVPERSITLARGRETLHFCSTTCRDRLRRRRRCAPDRRTEAHSGRTA